MYRRILLIVVLGLSLAACTPYYDGGSTYYRSEVYSTPAPVYYYGGGSYYQDRNRYYSPAPRYYSAPRYYQPAPRYYQPAPRMAYRAYPNRGWDQHRGPRGDYRGRDERAEHGNRGHDRGHNRGERDGRGDRGHRGGHNR